MVETNFKFWLKIVLINVVTVIVCLIVTAVVVYFVFSAKISNMLNTGNTSHFNGALNILDTYQTTTNPIYTAPISKYNIITYDGPNDAANMQQISGPYPLPCSRKGTLDTSAYIKCTNSCNNTNTGGTPTDNELLSKDDKLVLTLSKYYAAAMEALKRTT